jgi:ubiquinone/menaquinone biosynthesis C-methylase UbiE
VVTTLAPTAAPSSPFDEIAEQYDTTFTFSTIGQIQRDVVWDELMKSFRPGDRVLDIGCGTGVDARFLAERGIDVIACDTSKQMLNVAARRMLATPHPPGSVQLRLLPAEEISNLQSDAPYDGAFSNFGAVNCVENIAKLKDDLALLLKPEANLLLCLMGPLCLWETAWYLLHGNVSKAFRRLRPGGVEAHVGNSPDFHVQYPSARSIRKMFAPSLRLKAIRGVGVAIPPSYLEAWAKRSPAMLRHAANADRFLGRCPGVRVLADHVLLHFERTIESETL